MSQLGSIAQGLRDEYEIGDYKNGHYWADLTSDEYKDQFSKGINNGLVTETGGYLLHGSQSNPEWVMTNDQMYSLVKNLSNNTMPSIPSGFSEVGSGIGDINLSITVNGDADNGVISGITSAGENIVSDIKKIFNKNGVYA